ncbi:DNA-protecting protein DprA [Porphyrobacter sp. ULC335]|uniref:DNA-protecting protein DprA n=1 Tax=Porphyrobacter sp. ULC335 TaxID=2854260 RepID=UPI002221070D|nr:DNA-protecting protein DprA [Porphyrobacter sp. ULC335]UYV17004.1 DNA-protecting protein DprA [Porphyrobacter sp. ULC335]
MSALLPHLSVLKVGDDAYPKRLKSLLGSHAPAELHVAGNQDLLGSHAVSFCGARNASEKGIEAAALCARKAVSENFIITSGNARGVDRATHFEALLNGGATVLVLPEGLDRFRIAPELREVWDWERVLVVSQFVPSAIWRAYQAMQRNKVIMGMSCAMIVIEAGEKGGTRAAGEEALRIGVPLFAVDYGFDETVAPGNRHLIASGAKRLKRNRQNGQPNLSELISDARSYCEGEWRVAKGQASLF